MCDGDQALTGEDIRELGAMVSTLPQLLGRTLTPAALPAAIG